MYCGTASKFFSFCLIAFFAISWHAPVAESANILGLFPSHSPSHAIIHMSIAKALAEKGHNVTTVTSHKPKVNHKSINSIIIPPSKEFEAIFKEQVSIMAKKDNNFFEMMTNFLISLKVMFNSQVDLLKDPKFTVLYENPDTKFDLVILGYFMNDFGIGVAAKFKCPYILSWMGPTMEMTDSYLGNPREIAYVPTMNVAQKVGEPMGFLKRLQNLAATLFFGVVKAIINYQNNNYYHELFGAEKNFPTFAQMQKNASLAFCNNHFSEGPVRPNVPGIIEIGGIQVKDKPNPLPKEIAEFLDSAKDVGAVLFSLGSNVQATDVQAHTTQAIFRALSSIKQKVIWKWEDPANLPGKSANILYSKWVPQDDILAHPNVKLFITHAGKGGVAEAQYHAVPMVALPVFGDQHANAEKLVESGYGLQRKLTQLTDESLKEAVLEVLNNPSYAEKVKRFSKLYRDRPMTAKENVVFWTEYVIRHHGASHMQSPLVHLNWFQTCCLDTIAVLVLALYALWRLLKFIFVLAFRKLFSKRGAQASKNSKTGYKKVKKQ